MRKTLWGMALGLLKANRLLISFSVISILISTLLITTLLMYSLNAEREMERSFREMFGEADIMVSYPPGHSGVLTREMAERIVSLPGVEASAHVLSRFLHIGESNVPVWTIGTTANDLTRSTYKFNSYLVPSTIILNEELARFLKVAVGDEVVVEGKGFRTAEIIEDPQGLTSIAIIHYDDMASFVGEGEYASGLMLKLARGVEALSIAQKIRDMDGHLRIDLVEQNELVQSNMRTLQIYIIVLSFLVLVVTSLLVLSNLEILLYKLRNQISILRSIGAATAQIGRIVLIQSVAINLTGTVLGMTASVLAREGLFRVAGRVFRMPADAGHASDFLTAFITAAACFLFFQLFMIIPAWRSTRILPLQIAEENERLDFRRGKGRRLIGWGAALTGGGLYLFGYIEGKDYLLFPGMVLLLIGSLSLMPRAVEWVLRGSMRAGGRQFGRLTYLTLLHMLPQVRRNAFAIVSIALTLAIAVFGTTLLATLEENNLRFLKERYAKPIILHNRLGPKSDIDPHRLRETLLGFESIREVEMEGILLQNYILFKDEAIRIYPRAVYASSVEGLKDDELVISEKLAYRHNLKAGDAITVGRRDPEGLGIHPVGVYRIAKVSEKLGPEDVLMTWSNTLNTFPAVNNLYIDPADEEQALADLESLRSQYPELQISTLRDAREQARAGFIQRWGIFVVVLSAIIGCSMAGVLNGLMNQFLSKRKEYAVLRTVGLTPAGILVSILVQTGLYVGLGIIFGGMLGMFIFLLVLALDPTPVAFDFATVGLVAVGMLIVAVATLAVAGRHITSGHILREMAMDGK